MARKRTEFYKNYFLQGGLSERDIAYIEKTLSMERVDKLKGIVPSITLRDQQTIAVGLSYINKRFLVGFKPGLGKTVVSSASYLLAKSKREQEGGLLKKLILVTTSEHLLSMTREMRSYGINLVPLYGDKRSLTKITKTFDLDDPTVDGVACSWKSLLTNGFLFYFTENREKFEMIIFDESSALKNDKSKTWANAKLIADGMDRVLMLNGSPFETHIMDIFNQFKILNENVMPVKKFIMDNYTVAGKNSWWGSKLTRDDSGNYEMKRSLNSSFVIADYKNQDDLKHRLKYHAIFRSKKDFAKDLPEHTYTLIPVEMTFPQEDRIKEDRSNYATFLNSPATSYDIPINADNVPKFGKILEMVENLYGEQIAIYCLHVESQLALCRALKKKGYRVGLINGQQTAVGQKMTPELRADTIDSFNNGDLDILIFNTTKAINLPNCDTMFMYNIPNNPQTTYQVLARIDRNNYDISKSYYFFCYLRSPEVSNMVNLALHREINANEFTGSSEVVYQQLIKQLENFDTNLVLEPMIDEDLDPEADGLGKADGLDAFRRI